MKLSILGSIFTMSFVLLLSSCYYDKEDLLYGESLCDTIDVKYSIQVKNIIDANCRTCHNASSPSAQLDLTNDNTVKSIAANGRLLGSIKGDPNYKLMPPSGKLSNCNISQIKAWINQGMKEN